MSDPAGLLRRLGANTVRAGRLVLGRSLLAGDAETWLSLRLDAPLPERALPWMPFARGADDGAPTLLEALRVLDAAAKSDDVAGVLLHVGGAPGGLAATQSLHRAVAALRAAGKPVIAFGEPLGLAAVWIAAGATEVWMPPAGSVPLVGLRAEGVFVRGLLERLGVTPDVLRVGTHKTAAEMLTRTSMSQEQREQLEAWIDDVWTAFVGDVAAGRGIAPDDVRARIDAGPYTAASARDAGLVDRLLPADELDDALDERFAGPAGLRVIDALAWLRLRGGDPGWQPLLRAPATLAYVVATGSITRGSGSRGIAARTLAALLETLTVDASIRAIVLRVDSPGGDAFASDELWHAVLRATYAKPVVVSMGEVAASGGYYLASAADAIVAESATLTGSIGVVGGKIHLEGLYAKLGVSRDGVERGARAGLLSETRGFTTDEEKTLRSGMLELYGTFLSRVAEGRRLSRDEVERVAQGRVWSGARAHRIGLVDRLGGPLEALAEARARAELAVDEPMVLRAMPATPEFLRWFARPGAARLSTPSSIGAGSATARDAHVGMQGRSADA